jgi:hypothetical protein
MTKTAFYAWQSDRDEDVCRFLIRDAARLALKKLKADTKITSAPSFELDHDTKGVAGHPHIASVIRRKIKQCAVFIADVTHVAKYITADGRDKYAQNANVMIELGIAIRAKGFERLLLVMNDHFGPVTELPFDLKSHSFPITYTLAPGADKATRKAACEALAQTITAKLRGTLQEIAAEAEHAQQVASAEAASRAAEAEKRAWASLADRRRAFETSVMDGLFRGLEAAPPLLAMSLQPLEPLPHPLDLRSHSEVIGETLRPLDADGFDPRPHGESIVTRTYQRWNKAAGTPTGVTEITTDGSIFAAVRMEIERLTEPEGITVVDFHRYEGEVFGAIETYLRLLRTRLGVSQRLAFTLSLRGVKNALLSPTHAHRYYAQVVRPLEANEIVTKPIEIPANKTAANRKDAGAMVKVAFDFLWREGGLDGDPYLGPKA